jgi:hypothetical protein
VPEFDWDKTIFLPIIGLTGYAQHGKDSVGQMLVELYGYTRFAFADQLREMAYRLNPIVAGATRLQDVVDAVGWEAAKTRAEVRRILQVMGTECVRDILGDDAWVKALQGKLNDYGTWTFPDSGALILPGARSVYAGPPVVITDVRFLNEAKAIHEWGGEVWKVVRLNPNGTMFDNGIGVDHPSERYISSIVPDVTFEASNLDQLKAQVMETI